MCLYLWLVSMGGGRITSEVEMYLGIDVGSVSTDIVVIDDKFNVVASAYLPTAGDPIWAIKKGLEAVHDAVGEINISGVGTTGSGRELAGLFVGADVVKNEITAHTVAALQYEPNVRTIIEIGGQDSKIIIVRNRVPVDFAMNTVCAAGTGSFLDHQANRLGIPIEEFGDYALRAKSPARIAGRCTVFAESDMIHKQQLGYKKEDIIAGLCEALVRNFLANVAKGKEVLPPVLFQGGVASNKGMVMAFRKILGLDVIVPPYHKFMGAIGVAILARDHIQSTGGKTQFKGFRICEVELERDTFICKDCPNECEVVILKEGGQILAVWGSRCGKWRDRLVRGVTPTTCTRCVR